MGKQIRWVAAWLSGRPLAGLARLALLCAFGSPAWAAGLWPAPPAPEVLLRMSEAQALATLQRVVRAQRALAPGRAGRLDTTPPVLERFDAGPILNVTKQLATVQAPFEARDDQSGVLSVYGEAVDDKGRRGVLVARYQAPQPAKRLQGVLALTRSPKDLMAPGPYTFALVWLTDAAGNLAVYDRAALAALGDPTVKLRNPQGFDVTGPTLVNGVILTPEISLADHQQGTDQPPYAAVRLGVEDTGGTVISGLGYARMRFCLKDLPDICLYLQDVKQVPHQASALVAPAAPLRQGATPGVYHLQWVQFIDLAGNYTTLTSTEIGGDTDFSLYFPSTTITVTADGATPVRRAAPTHPARKPAPPSWPCDEPGRPMGPPPGQATAGRRDVIPPVLTRFDADPELNVDAQLATPRVHFEARDDKSGIACVMAWANGPQEGVVYVTYPSALPVRHLKAVLADGGQPKDLMPPGVYTFAGAMVSDAAGHSSVYDAAQLAALGNTTVKVRNPQGYDLKPPVLVNGMILTPEISLSDHHPGTDQPPYFSLTLGVEDRGNSMTSGLEEASASLCTLPPNVRCIGASMWLELSRQSSGGVHHRRPARTGQHLTSGGVPPVQPVAERHGAQREPLRERAVRRPDRLRSVLSFGGDHANAVRVRCGARTWAARSAPGR